MQTIAISGCAGYIGTYAVRYFLSKGYSVKGLDNLSNHGHGDNLFAYINNPNFEFKIGNINNYQDCLWLINGTDYIIHAAALVGMPCCKKNPWLAKLTNVDGTKNMILARNEISKHIPFIGCFTGSQYGVVEGICTEESPQNTDTVYGLTKKEAESIILEYENTISLRHATCFGLSPSMRVNLLINDFVNQAINNKSISIFEADARRTFIHISDFIRVLEFSMLNIHNMKYNIYNTGDSRLQKTKREIAELIKLKTGCTIFYGDFGKDDDKRDYACSFNRLNNEGFSCETTIEQGIDELIKAAPLIQLRNPYG